MSHAIMSDHTMTNDLLGHVFQTLAISPSHSFVNRIPELKRYRCLWQKLIQKYQV